MLRKALTSSENQISRSVEGEGREEGRGEGREEGRGEGKGEGRGEGRGEVREVVSIFINLG